ncbi:MAG: hypothetical protein D6788_05515 [Planctomycetota bacterium]|nr:MAG: hypothetical protein D6788_05515 [Planctomycetota bacterium]
MTRRWRRKKLAGLLVMQAVLFGVGGSCLPENFFAETAGDITAGLLTSVVNMTLSGSGLEV